MTYYQRNKDKLKELRKIRYRDNKEKELLWILEHPTTFTAGIRSTDDEVIDKKIKIIRKETFILCQ